MSKARPTTKADETPEFQEFWAVWYPVKNKNDGRGDARDAFFQHVEQRGADPKDLVDGAKWFVFDGGNKEFKQHAQTWLNRRAYEDGAEEWRKYQRILAEKQTNVVNINRPQPVSRSKWAIQYEREKALKQAAE